MRSETIRYLTQDELRKLLDAIPTNDRQGKRDKALLYLARAGFSGRDDGA